MHIHIYTHTGTHTNLCKSMKIIYKSYIIIYKNEVYLFALNALIAKVAIAKS